MLWMRLPRSPMQEPTGSTPSCREATAILLRTPGSRETARISTVPLLISGTSASIRRRSRSRWERLTTTSGPRAVCWTSTRRTLMFCPLR